MPKRSSKVAPSGASGAKASSRKAGSKAHFIWYNQNLAQATVLQEKAQAGVELSPKEHDFLSWWAGYCSANPDPKSPPRFSPSVIRRDADPMD